MLGAVISLKWRGGGKEGEVLRGVCNNSCRLFVDTCKSGGGEWVPPFVMYTVCILCIYLHYTVHAYYPPASPPPHHFLDTLNGGKGHEGKIAAMPMLEEKAAWDSPFHPIYYDDI